jgi:hypothetical protein
VASESFEDFVAAFGATVEAASRRLLGVPRELATRRPVPQKWSCQEVIGHLVDSAANNHARFVRARLESKLVFDGYAQDAWVAAQPYREADWPELVELWRLYNRHIAALMRSTPERDRTRMHAQHSLDRIAWKLVPASEPTSLEYLMRDYGGHLEHHLRQAFAVLERVAP